jgi:acyl-CoA synthetase (AMP-forming)/AMP-acid ligase II
MGRRLLQPFFRLPVRAGSPPHHPEWLLSEGRSPIRRFYILDTHQPVPVGVAGELCIGGNGLARGYLNRPELTAEKFIAHPSSTEPGARIYRTGDLARYRPDGNIEFLGRLDQQVKIRGHRIELEEIEATLRLHAGISQCVVSAMEALAGEKRLVAWIVPADSNSKPPIAEFRDLLKQKLPEFMVRRPPSKFCRICL